MNPLLIGTLISLLGTTVLQAERQIAEIAQPLSLLGTEGEADPLKDGQYIPAIILTRPTLVGGAFPESPIHAMCLPHRIAGATEGFPEESNLILLVGGAISAEWGNSVHIVHADFSKASVPKNFGLSLIQVMLLTAECLQQNLARKDDKKPIKIVWKIPLDMKFLKSKLPSEIQ